MAWLGLAWRCVTFGGRGSGRFGLARGAAATRRFRPCFGRMIPVAIQWVLSSFAIPPSARVGVGAGRGFGLWTGIGIEWMR